MIASILSKWILVASPSCLVELSLLIWQDISDGNIREIWIRSLLNLKSPPQTDVIELHLCTRNSDQ